MSEDEPLCEIHNDGEELFVLIDGTKIAKRGLRNTAQAKTSIMLEPGWTVRDIHNENAIEVRYEGARIH
jgi:archaellum component FlaG (FlaF/FlaG flagellin family)